MLKKISKYIAEPLTDVINKCFETWRLILKTAQIVPIFKSG